MASDDDEDDDFLPAPKKPDPKPEPKAAPPKAAPKKVALIEDDYDEEEDDFKPAPRKEVAKPVEAPKPAERDEESPPRMSIAELQAKMNKAAIGSGASKANPLEAKRQAERESMASVSRMTE